MMVIPYEDVGVGLLKDSTLMETFAIPPPNMPRTIANINMITSSTMPFDDPSIVPSESKLDYYGNEMPLIPYELAYVAMKSLSDISSTDTDQVNVVNDESYSLPTSTTKSFSDHFQHIFSSDEIFRMLGSRDLVDWQAK